MLAANGFLFGTVIIVVCAIGVIGGLIGMRRSGSGSGSWWFFRGPSDSSPVSAPGARLEDRHELDPPPGEDAD
jgi:hypothetical protein